MAFNDDEELPYIGTQSISLRLMFESVRPRCGLVNWPPSCGVQVQVHQRVCFLQIYRCSSSVFLFSTLKQMTIAVAAETLSTSKSSLKIWERDTTSCFFIHYIVSMNRRWGKTPLEHRVIDIAYYRVIIKKQVERTSKSAIDRRVCVCGWRRYSNGICISSRVTIMNITCVRVRWRIASSFRFPAW